MSNDSLNGLALMLIHRDVELSPDAVVEEFSHTRACNLFYKSKSIFFDYEKSPIDFSG